MAFGGEAVGVSICARARYILNGTGRQTNSTEEASVNPNQLTIEKVQEILLAEKYVCDRALATVVYLSLAMGKPLLLEGEAGVGKTEIAKVLAKVLGAKLIRLQCYEGLDANTALYEWNYPKQMLRIEA
jgi:MoxR-like ATPase